MKLLEKVADVIVGTQYPKLPIVSRLAYTALLRTSEDRDSIWFGGTRWLGSLVGISHTSAGKAMEALRAAGLLTFEGRPSRGITVGVNLPDPSLLTPEFIATFSPGPTRTAQKRESRKERKQVKTVQEQQEKQLLKDAEKEMSKVITDDHIRAITGSFEGMTLYLLYGSQAALAGTSEGFKPTNLNWRSVEGYCVEDPKYDLWTAPMFAGYYWYLVSYVRLNNLDPQQGLTIPSWGPLIGTMRNFLMKETHQQLQNRIWFLCRHWYAVLEQLGPTAEERFVLNENTIGLTIIHDKQGAAMELGQGGLDQLYERRRQRLEKEAVW